MKFLSSVLIMCQPYRARNCEQLETMESHVDLPFLTMSQCEILLKEKFDNFLNWDYYMKNDKIYLNLIIFIYLLSENRKLPVYE